MSSGEKIDGDGGGGSSEWDMLTTGDIEKTEHIDQKEFVEAQDAEKRSDGTKTEEAQLYIPTDNPITFDINPTGKPLVGSEFLEYDEDGSPKAPFMPTVKVGDLTDEDINKFVASAEAPDYNELVKRELPKLEKDFEGVTVEKEPVESRTVDGSGEEVFHKRSEVGDEPKLGGALYDGDYTPRPSQYYRHNESTPEPTPEPTPAVREYTEQEKAERQRILDKIADVVLGKSSTEQQ